MIYSYPKATKLTKTDHSFYTTLLQTESMPIKKQFGLLFGEMNEEFIFSQFHDRIRKVEVSKMDGFKFPLISVTDELINDMAAIIAREVNPEAIILFGSHATGNARPESDIDLLVIETAPFGPGRDRRKEMTRLWRALAGFTIAKDILVYSHEEVEQWRNSRNHIIARAFQEGRIVYGSM